MERVVVGKDDYVLTKGDILDIKSILEKVHRVGDFHVFTKSDQEKIDKLATLLNKEGVPEALLELAERIAVRRYWMKLRGAFWKSLLLFFAGFSAIMIFFRDFQNLLDMLRGIVR